MNLFFTSSIILFFASFLMGLLVYLKDRKNNLNKLWFVFSIFVASWSILLYFVTSARTESEALFWQYPLDVFALGIPVAYFYFVATFLNLKISRIFSFVVLFITLCLAIFSTTTFFKVGIIKKFTFFWVDAGPYYFIFPTFFLLLILYALFLLVSAYYKSKDDIIRSEQIKYQIIAGVVGFSGGVVNFLPQLFNVFPFGSHVILLYISLVSYLILKYRLFNVKLILVELAIILLNLFLFINVFTSQASADLYLNIFVSVTVFLFSIVLMRGIYKDIRDRERIAVLASDMEVANERMRALEGQKTEFVSIASHQLRTPLTVIKGYASMILEGTFGKISDDARGAIENLYKSSERIVALVEDLLTVSRIEQGRMMLSFEPVKFGEFVQKTLSESEKDAKEAGVTISFDEGAGTELLASIDEKKFKQVIFHILDNAIKYTTAPGTVSVAIDENSITNKIRLIISDTGVGMTQEQIAAIFEHFNLKANINEKAEFDGTIGVEEVADINNKEEESGVVGKRTPGIGLYIAQEIVEAHHGTISIESAGPERGTTVTVELPKAEEGRG